MTKPHNVLHELIDSVETTLAAFYHFTPVYQAVDHLLSAEEAKHQGLPAKANEQARLFIVSDPLDSESMFIGLSFNDKIQESLQRSSPLRQLTTQNLNDFCVVVEEVSHFHLVVNRAVRDQPVTQLELEWQAEIDKLLLSSHTLHQQANDAHVDALMYKLYDEASIVVRDAERYEQATKLAVQFWQLFSAKQSKGSNPYYSYELRSLLRESYHLSLDNKVNKLTRAA